MAIAVVVAGLLHELLPEESRVAPSWVYPSLLIAFLVVLVVGDPGRIDRQRRWLQVTTGLMIAVITLVNAVAAVLLVKEILYDGQFETARELLATGAVIWVTNVIAFALWSWNTDAGGAAARASRPTAQGHAWVFPEMTLRDFVPQGWYPTFPDYLVLSINTALAFSPTDVLAVKLWAKIMMVSESLISLVLGALVIARAINVL